MCCRHRAKAPVQCLCEVDDRSSATGRPRPRAGPHPADPMPGRYAGRSYVRVSTDHQSVKDQIAELRQVAMRRGWGVVEVYRGAGISGAKGTDKRPGLDGMLNDASRRKFDVVMAWAIDRLGRSSIDLRRPPPATRSAVSDHRPYHS